MRRRHAPFENSAPKASEATKTSTQSRWRRRSRKSSCFLCLLLFTFSSLIMILSNVRRVERELPVEAPNAAPVADSYEVSNDDDDYDDDDSEEEGDCRPLHDWQHFENSPMSCNLMHEMELDDLEFISCGGDRCAFKTTDSMRLEIVVKTPKFRKVETDPSTYEEGWKDTIAMERLSSSKHILDIYGNCGMSQVTELATGGNLHAQIKMAKLYGDTMSPETKLRIGYQIARAVADMHAIDGNVTSLVHNDLCCHQFLLVDSLYKLNDFHMASMVYKTQTGEACRDPPKGMNENLDKTRSPESLAYRIDGRKIYREKSDVWMMGNVLYYVFAKKYCFEDMPDKMARRLIANGTHSEIPPHLLDSKHPADNTMVNAIKLAWTHNPDDRPTARQIADMLEQQLKRLATDRDGDGVWRVSLPPLPPGFRFTDSDMYEHYGV